MQSGVTNLDNMFKDFIKLQDVNYFDTTGVTSASSMFENCALLRYTKRYYLASCTNLSKMYKNSGLMSVPSFNTSGCENFSEMFSGCSSLQDCTKLYNISSGTNVTNMFYGCTSLSNDSLNKIMELLPTMTNYSGTKTLAEVGLSSTQATTCQSLSNYSSFISSGWTTGF